MSAKPPLCPKCYGDLARREAMFFWRGEYEDGWVCPIDKGLWAIAGEEIPPLRGTGLAFTRKGGQE